MDTTDFKKSLISFSNGLYSNFLEGQLQIIESVMNGINTLGILPTSHGKSLCFQLPIFLGLRPAIVISPLIALMIDQVDNLRNKNITADFINSKKSFQSQVLTLKKYLAGKIDLLYISPERLSDTLFVYSLKKYLNKKIRFIVIDEAHCFSEWGHDFRLDYLSIPKFINNFDSITTLCLTATASKEVRHEIEKNFQIKRTFHNFGTYRKNLKLNVYEFSNIEDKEKKLYELISKYNNPGIVYTNGIDTAEKLSEKFRHKGFKTSCFHSELKSENKENIIQDFKNKKIDILFSTNAFGMGINIKFIRFIIHFRIPSSLDQYIQEIGRAGRDNQESFCDLFYCSKDKGIISRQIKENIPKPDDLREIIEEKMFWTANLKSNIKKHPKYSDDKIFSIVAKQLIKYNYYEFIGDTYSFIELDENYYLKNFVIENNKVDIRDTANLKNVPEVDIINEIYELYLNEKVNIKSKSEPQISFKILNKKLNSNDLNEINDYFTSIINYKKHKLNELIDYININDEGMRIQKINDYFK